MAAARLDWPAILVRADAIVRSYSTRVTLRQLFYRLVAAGVLPNNQTAYKGLSSKSAQARRDGWFPELLDMTRNIHRRPAWDSPGEIMDGAIAQYRRDRTEGQESAIYLGVEKATLIEQMNSWFGDLGLPIVPLRGYASQSFTDQVRNHVLRDGRPAVLIYAGDFDPSGEDIDRDFADRTDCWDNIIRVAVNSDTIVTYGLDEMPGKPSDARAAAFEARHGRLVQVEVEALDPTDLRQLFQDELDGWWDTSAYDAAIEREEEEREVLRTLRRSL